MGNRKIENNKISRRSVIKKGIALGGIASTPFFINGKASAAKQKLVVQLDKRWISLFEKGKGAFISKFPDADVQFVPLTGEGTHRLEMDS